MTRRTWLGALLLTPLMAWGQTDISGLPPFFEGELLDPELDETPEEYMIWLIEAGLMQEQKTLPVRVDPMTWLDSVSLDAVEMRYAYRFEFLFPEDENLSVLERRMWPIVIMNTCDNPLAHLVFALGRSVLHHYLLPDGERTVDVRVDSELCAARLEFNS